MTGRAELVATYLVEMAGDGERAAEAFATGQSIGSWLPVPGITPEMRDQHGARVVAAVTASRAAAPRGPVGEPSR